MSSSSFFYILCTYLLDSREVDDGWSGECLRIPALVCDADDGSSSLKETKALYFFSYSPLLSSV